MGSKPIDISASRGAAILGLSPWSTPVDVWLEIMEDQEPGFCEANDYEPPVFEENSAMRWGLAFEDAICRHVGGIRDREKFFKHKEHDFITCHIDGIYDFEQIFFPRYQKDFEEPLIHEAKTSTTYAYRDSWGEPGTDMIPRHYQIQVQHQMMLTGLNYAVVSVLVWPRRTEDWDHIEHPSIMADSWIRPLDEMGFFHQYFLKRNNEIIEMILDEYKIFWAEYVLEKKPPPPINYSDIRKLIRAPSGTIVANDTMERWSAEYKSINEEIRRVQKRKEEIKTEILKYMKSSIQAADEDSADKWILRDSTGKKMHQYDGKVFR